MEKKMILVCLIKTKEFLLEISFFCCFVALFGALFAISLVKETLSPAPKKISKMWCGTIWKVHENIQFLIKFFIGWYIALYLCQFFLLRVCPSVGFLSIKSLLSRVIFFALAIQWAINFKPWKLLNIISVENWSSICWVRDNWKSGGKEERSKHF